MNTVETKTVVRTKDEGELLSVLGHRARVVLSKRDTGGALSMFDYSSPQGSGVPPHIHMNEDEIWFVLEGAIEVTIEGVTHRVEPGGVAYGPRGIEHAFMCVGKGTNRFILLTTPGGFEDFFRDVDAETTGPGTPAMGRVLELVSKHGMTMRA